MIDRLPGSSAFHEELSSAPDLAALARALEHLVVSSQPTVVFSSLARLCVPAFSDRCLIDIVETGNASYRIRYPQDDADEAQRRAHAAPGASAQQLVTTFAVPADGHGAGFSGAVVHSWLAREPSGVDSVIARLMLDRATAAICEQRLADAYHQAHDAAEQLKVALVSNRQIGAAMGVLMATHKITDKAAFDLLRAVSQRSHRKLRDVADDVVRTGWIEPA